MFAKDFKEGLKLDDLKVHIWCFVIVILAEMIGTISISIKGAGGAGVSFSLFPMLFAVAIGILLGVLKKVDDKTMKQASPYIGISVMLLTAKMSSSIGPAWNSIVTAGPALLLQEFGNLGTILFSLPVAVLVFKMGREAVGCCFSISREGSLAIIADKYGLDSPEGTGVMGGYLTGTVLGTVFNGIMSSLLVSLNLFHPYALAMACGTGSASMMTAALAPVLAAFPDMVNELNAFAATSQTLTGCDGLYMSLLIAVPFTNWFYKVLKGKDAKKAPAEV